jgi:DivIVA domain-containing protein
MGSPDREVATGARHCGGGAHLAARSMGSSGGEGLPSRLGRVGRVHDIFIHRSEVFSSTGLKSGHNKQEVDAFRSAVRDTFLGVSKPPVRSDDLRGKQFSTHRPGYDKTQVTAFLDAAGIRLAALESMDRPAGPLVSGARLVLWAEWADWTTFRRRSGYTATEVDRYLRAIRDTFLVRLPGSLVGNSGPVAVEHRPCPPAEQPYYRVVSHPVGHRPGRCSMAEHVRVR